MPLNHQEIPTIFYNTETRAPIDRCLVCNSYLLIDTDYIIEKAIVNYPTTDSFDLIWEFAMCIDCMTSVLNEYSKQSHTIMDNYFKKNMNFTRLHKLISEKNYNIDEWIKECIITGKRKNQCNQYQLCLQCKGKEAIFDRTPFLISDEALDEISQLLSNQTIDAMNQFRDKHFPPPEDLNPFFRKKDFLIV